MRPHFSKGVQEALMYRDSFRVIHNLDSTLLSVHRRCQLALLSVENSVLCMTMCAPSPVKIIFLHPCHGHDREVVLPESIFPLICAAFDSSTMLLNNSSFSCWLSLIVP